MLPSCRIDRGRVCFRPFDLRLSVSIGSRVSFRLGDRFPASFAYRSSCCLSAPWYLVTSLAFRLFGSIVVPIFNLPSTPLGSTPFHSSTCSSPIRPLSMLKRWIGNGFVKLSVMFTLVSTFRSSSFCRWWAPRSDDISPQYDELDFKWGGLCSVTRNTKSVMDGWFGSWQKGRLTVVAARWLLLLPLTRRCTRPLLWRVLYIREASTSMKSIRLRRWRHILMSISDC